MPSSFHSRHLAGVTDTYNATLAEGRAAGLGHREAVDAAMTAISARRDDPTLFAQELAQATLLERAVFWSELCGLLSSGETVVEALAVAAHRAGLSGHFAVVGFLKTMRLSDTLGEPKLREWEEEGDILRGLREDFVLPAWKAID